MLSPQLQSEVKVLSRTDKIELMHFILNELTYQDTPELMMHEKYPVWSPYGADKAAQTLQEMLNQGDGNAK